MPGNAPRRPNQPASGPAVGSIFIGLGPLMSINGSDHTENGPLYRDTQTPSWSRCTCFDTPEDYGGGPWAEAMIPSPLGRGLPSRWGTGKSF
jgi:hypothetical protein